MKTILLALLGAAAVTAACPATAGPDWAVIERGRAAARAAHPCADTHQRSTAATPARTPGAPHHG
ncbi:hypothetical protein LMG31506_01338 [Cupriavidus yeoncheonensis]|uniref:Lipoprotein n=1 Tax=Cupriavidus yeoncheonensis TaxID=1462994 RepID=A0A916IRQ8_9BURK|nr:hypothetical protein [Cupriavidus yeoncheonensis]CAG2134211.1 hypothetical protein LMG31506_01338 [Cupriavidus yeoncheonensis]